MTTRTSPKEKRRELADAKRRIAAHGQPENPAARGIILRDEYRYTDNRTIRRGDLFQVSGGPQLHDGTPMGERGTFRFISAWCELKGWYVLCSKVDRHVIDTKTGVVSIDATRALFVAGTPYPNAASPLITMRPYGIHRLRDETARKAGLQGMTRAAATEARR